MVKSQNNTPRRSRRTTSVEPTSEEHQDIKEPVDEEYNDDAVKYEEDEEEDDAYTGEEEEDDDGILQKRKRRSSSRHLGKSQTPADGEEEDEEDEGEGEEEEEEEGEDEEHEGDVLDENGHVVKKQKLEGGRSAPKVKGRRGRKAAIAPPGTLKNDKGRVLEVVDDEYDLSDDEEGETKISRSGKLQGGRQFRVRTFPVKGKGDRLYMLSTEPARCMGFRDSYLLFQKHRFLYKVVVSQEEKYDLIDREIIPHSYKGRVIGLVTARSIFKEFGAKIIVGGRNITDDYYATRLRKEGKLVEGSLAEPEDSIPPLGTPYNQNQFVAWHGASNVYHGGPVPIMHPQYVIPQNFEAIELKSVKALKSNARMNEENWMLQHALSVRDLENSLLQGRLSNSRGLRDPYTGVTFVPQSTQPSHVTYKKVVGGSNPRKLTYETKMESSSLARCTGLQNVPLEIFENCVDEETKKAILRQQEYERAV